MNDADAKDALIEELQKELREFRMKDWSERPTTAELELSRTTKSGKFETYKAKFAWDATKKGVFFASATGNIIGIYHWLAPHIHLFGGK